MLIDLFHESQFATSFGLVGRAGERERFAAELRAHLLAVGPGGGVLAEAFRRIPLARPT